MASSTFVPWEQRPGWTDISPIPQSDSEHALVAINYSPEYTSAMSAFRYILSKAEISLRVLELTAAIVKLNPAHYTVWAYRSKTLLALRKSEADGDQLLIKELAILDDLVKVHLKNYQVWQHRRIIVSALNDPSRELPFTTRALGFDAKNYHTWAYRQWALSHFYRDPTAADYEKVWKDELDFSAALLKADVRNNSAWNHRWFVAFEREEAGQAIIEREIDFAKSKLLLAPNNPSAWNYLRGVLDRHDVSYAPHVSFARELRSPVDPDAQIPLAVEFIADGLAAEPSTTGADTNGKEVAELYDLLSTKLDPIRKGYWEWRKTSAAYEVGATA